MIWLTWRQFRAQAVTAAAALALFAILLAVTHPQLASLYASTGFAGCHGGGCGQPADAFLGAFAMAVTEGFSLLQAWWAAPISRAIDLGGSVSVFSGSRFSPFAFATGGTAPLGYAAFGFALGVTAGLLIRRAVPAMALTLAIFVAVQVVMPLWIRPHLLPADQTTVAIAASHATFSDLSGAPALTATAVPGQPGAWILSSGPVDAAGRAVSALPAACGQTAGSGTPASSLTTGSPSDVVPCLAGHGIREAVSYQPASHYWPLQLTETGIFLALALGLAGFCFWWLDRRLA
jgi:hypothetical protein